MVVFAIAHGSGRVRMLLRLLEEQASGDEGCREARRLLEPRQGSWLAGEPYLEALAAAIAAARDPLLLIRLGLSYDPRLSGPLGFLMLNKPTVRDSLGTLARCCGLTVRGATFALADDEPCAILRYDIDKPAEQACHDVEFTLTSCVALLRRLTGTVVPVGLVSFAHKPRAPKSHYARIVGAPVLFEQPVNLLSFEGSVLDQPVVGADPELLLSLNETLSWSGADEATAGDIVQRARVEVARRLSSQGAGIATVASALCLSPRTLQRHLEEHGLSFSQLRDQVRRERAVAMLSQANLSLGEISFRLGFTDISCFYRSFRQWTGWPPGAYRQYLRHALLHG